MGIKRCIVRIALVPFFCAMLTVLAWPAQAQTTNAALDPFGRALIPGLLADPSIVDMDGTFYCYATTDGCAVGRESSRQYNEPLNGIHVNFPVAGGSLCTLTRSSFPAIHPAD
jgi:hypothetical protein